MSGSMLLPPCPVCNGPTTLLGQLGNVTHGRCRNCGMTYAVTMEDEDEVRDEIEQEQAAADYSDDHDHDPNEEE